MMKRSCVVFWGMERAAVEALVGPDLALWPIDTVQDLTALMQHLHTNWDLRVIWIVGSPETEDYVPYHRIQSWWNGVDEGASRLNSADFGAIPNWVQLYLAQETVFCGRLYRVSTLFSDFRQRVRNVEVLYGPRRAVSRPEQVEEGESK